MILDSFQIEVGGEWRPSPPGLSAWVATHRPGAVRLGPIDVPQRFRWDRLQTNAMRETSPRRVRAAEKALENQRVKAGLFAAQVEAAQPTAEQRVADADAETVRWWTAFNRTELASRWALRRQVMALTPEARITFFLHLAWWQGPRQASYLSYVLKQSMGVDPCQASPPPESPSSPSSSPMPVPTAMAPSGLKIGTGELPTAAHS